MEGVIVPRELVQDPDLLNVALYIAKAADYAHRAELALDAAGGDGGMSQDLSRAIHDLNGMVAIATWRAVHERPAK